jgi:hypothetical protein
LRQRRLRSCAIPLVSLASNRHAGDQATEYTDAGADCSPPSAASRSADASPENTPAESAKQCARNRLWAEGAAGVLGSFLRR